MKHILTVGFLWLSCLGFSQISTIKVAPQFEETNYAPYDSTRNFLGKDVGQYVGQVLYLNGISEGLRKYEYKGFRADTLSGKWYKPNKMESGNNSESNYFELTGKYFKVLSVFKTATSEIYWLELEEQASKDRLYFIYDSKYEWEFPFIVVGFFEKHKAELVGDRFIFSNRLLGDEYDIHTGKKVTGIPYQEWTCKDFTIEEKYYTLGLLVENALGESIHVTLESVKNKDICNRRGFTVQEFRQFSKRFGDTNWKSIVEGIIRVGFTEEMAKMAWGEPKSINHSSYGDQWVYDSQYLYFEGGILRSFN